MPGVFLFKNIRITKSICILVIVSIIHYKIMILIKQLKDMSSYLLVDEYNINEATELVPCLPNKTHCLSKSTQQFK